MKNKRGVSELITTVLMILLVLAAIVIAWQVIKRTIGKSAESVETQSECIGLQLTTISVTKAANIINVQVSRGADSIAGDALIVTATCADGNSISKNGTITALGTATIALDCTAIKGVGTTSNVKVALKTDKGATCLAEEKIAELV